MTESTNRFLTVKKDRAFALAERLNQRSKPINHKTWYVGVRIYNKIVIDLDSHDECNLSKVLWFYQRLYATEFITVKTLHGYHLIQKEKNNMLDMNRLRCNLLFPGIPESRVNECKTAINLFFELQKSEREDKLYTLVQLQAHAKDMKRIITEAGLNHSIGDIDVLHALIGIQRGYYVLRVSKKSNDEKVIR